MQSVPLLYGPVRLTGALDVDQRPTGIIPRRLPHWTRPQVPPFMKAVATQPSGVRLEFSTDARKLELDLKLARFERSPQGVAPAVFDLVIDESEVLTPADEAHHIGKWAFDAPFVCGATNLGEALAKTLDRHDQLRGVVLLSDGDWNRNSTSPSA